MAAALKAELILLVKVLLVLGLLSVSSVLSMPESCRGEAGAGDFTMLDGRGRVDKGQRRQVFGKRVAFANEVVLGHFLRTGKGRHEAFHAFEELSEHCRLVEI